MSGLPPLTGFVSKELFYEATLYSPSLNAILTGAAFAEIGAAWLALELCRDRQEHVSWLPESPHLLGEHLRESEVIGHGCQRGAIGRKGDGRQAGTFSLETVQHFGGKVLGIGRRATVAAGKNFSVAQETVRHDSGGSHHGRCQRSRGFPLCGDACLEMSSYPVFCGHPSSPRKTPPGRAKPQHDHSSRAEGILDPLDGIVAATPGNCHNVEPHRPFGEFRSSGDETSGGADDPGLFYPADRFGSGTEFTGTA